MDLEASFKSLAARFEDLKLDFKDGKMVVGNDVSFTIKEEEQCLLLSIGGFMEVGGFPLPKDATPEEAVLMLFGWMAGRGR